MRTPTYKSYFRLEGGESSWRTLSSTLLIWSSSMFRWYQLLDQLHVWHWFCSCTTSSMTCSYIIQMWYFPLKIEWIDKNFHLPHHMWEASFWYRFDQISRLQHWLKRWIYKIDTGDCKAKNRGQREKSSWRETETGLLYKTSQECETALTSQY